MLMYYQMYKASMTAVMGGIILTGSTRILCAILDAPLTLAIWLGAAALGVGAGAVMGMSKITWRKKAVITSVSVGVVAIMILAPVMRIDEAWSDVAVELQFVEAVLPVLSVLAGVYLCVWAANMIE